MADVCFIPPYPAVDDAVDRLTEAAGALRDGDTEAASQALSLIDQAGVAAHWKDVGAMWSSRHDRTKHAAKQGSDTKRNLGTALKLEVAQRDGWRCRYCGLRVIAPATLSSIHKQLPEAYPSDHPTWRALRITWDHIDAFSTGGPHDLMNLVASCGACQFQAKGECTLDELGLLDPRDRPPVVDGWDGLSGWLGKAL